MVVSMVMLCLYRGAPGETRTLYSVEISLDLLNDKNPVESVCRFFTLFEVFFPDCGINDEHD